MDKHFAGLSLFFPDILSRRILDLGSGRGKFVVDISRRGGAVVGFEKNKEYIAITKTRLAEEGLSAELVEGEAEALPFKDQEFGFINMAELIEHVEDPEAVLKEAYRVLQKGGGVYVSVPNRFGMKDPHYHLYVVNWLPRSWAEGFIALFGRTKDDSGKAGRQKLSAMHYFTHEEFESLTKSLGFTMLDTRKEKIRRFPPLRRMLFTLAYALMRPWYFDTFHFVLKKS